MQTKLLIASVLGLFFSATPVTAASPGANLQVQLVAPATVNISTPTVYTVTVKNLGPGTAQNISLNVLLPVTNTSPQVYNLGTVTESETSCNIIVGKIVCTLGSLKNNKTATVTYTYTAPVSTKSLEMKAVVTASTSDPDSNNNTSSVVPNLVYPARSINSANVQNSHCTGTNLTSYFECLTAPSSISSHTTTLNSDFSISFAGVGTSGYSGSWSQPHNNKLKFEYFEFGSKVLEFNGFSTNGNNCFDGMASFFPASNYVSPYHVCIQ